MPLLCCLLLAALLAATAPPGLAQDAASTDPPPVSDPAGADPTATDSTAAGSSGATEADAPPLTTATRSGALTAYAEPYYLLSELNAGLPADTPVNLQTPQAALEHFVQASRAERYAEAARALNLNLLPADAQAERAAPLAERLFYVLDKQLGFDWEGLPDRPDGASTQPAGPDDPLIGQPRRSLLIGTLSQADRDVAIRLQRVKVGDGAPAWVFSPQTVENIEGLYRQYGPGPVDRLVPAWARVEVVGQTALWSWLALLVGLVLVVLLAWGVRRVTRRRLQDADSHWVRGLSERVATPVAVVVGLLLLDLLATVVLSLPAFVTTPLLVLLIAAFVWLAMRTIEYLTEHVARDQGVDSLKELSGDERTRQQHWLTYLSVGRRVLLFVVFLLGVGLVLSQFQSLEALGFSLMASAGVATVLLGIAAQPVLGNIVAGLQIAFTKPVRIGDSVVYEGDWGYVEDITYTYVLIQTWDQRRLVVPLRHLVTHPFENWTLRSAHLVKPIHLYADYTLDVDRVREKFDALLRSSDEWDEENEPTVQVTAVEDETIEIRALCSAKDPSTAWDLHCRLREELVAFLRDLDGGRYLPRQRVEDVGGAAASATASAGSAAAADATA